MLEGVPDPMHLEQDDISHRDNPELCLRGRERHCAVGRCDLQGREIIVSIIDPIFKGGFPELPCSNSKRIHTFSRNISRNHPPTTQPNPRRLPLSRIGLLRLRRARLQTHALHLGSIHECWRSLFTSSLRDSAAASDLIVGCLRGGGCREGFREVGGGGGGS